jgi:S-adenosylmethionine:tRNA ribosyltransferase-isomerase
MVVKQINIADFDYPLPEERIAKYPLDQRSESKLLVYKAGEINTAVFRALPQELPEGAALIFNNTKVIQARIPFQKETGAKIEIFCLEPHAPRDYAEAFQAKEAVTWQCMIGNAKKWKEGTLEKNLVLTNGAHCTIKAERQGKAGNAFLVRFTWNRPDLSFAEVLDQSGIIPIPPYLNRSSEQIDEDRYQTVYSKIKGSVAAPTAGLHFTSEVIEDLTQKKIATHEVTLHVGAGTFKPVKEDDAREHEMHTETLSVSRAFLEALASHKKPLISVGTTSMRTLESLYWLAHKIKHQHEQGSYQDQKEPVQLDQWEAYELTPELSRQEAFLYLAQLLKKKNSDTFHARTQIMITPEYTFRVVDGLITNFHQPKSTLLLLVSAFIGEDWKKVYEYALANDFRFLSYGDSSLLWPQKKG